MNEKDDKKNEISEEAEMNTENETKETAGEPVPEEKKPEEKPEEKKPAEPVQPSCKKEKKYCYGNSGKPCFYKRVLLALVLFAGCGLSAYAGGRIAGEVIKDELKEELEDSYGSRSYSDVLPYGFMDRFGNYGEDGSNGNGNYSPQNGLDGNSSATQENEEGAALGITVRQMTGSDNSGVVISGFADNSNAKQAGLAEGDEIVSLDGTKVSSLQEIHSFLKNKKAGDTVKVTAERNGEEVSADVTLIEKN